MRALVSRRALLARAGAAALLGAAGGCARGALPQPRATPGLLVFPARDRLVLVVSLDGVPGYALEDPRAPVPTLRRLARGGAYAARMTTVNPVMTWPNHATLATGVPPARHGVLFNGRLERLGIRLPVRVEPRERAELVRVPTVYDHAHAAGLRAAHVGWIPPQVGGSLDRSFRERPEAGGAAEAEAIAAGLLSPEELLTFRPAQVTWRDEIWMRVGIDLVKRRRPNLLMMHLLTTDSVHHQFGPGTLAGASAIALADTRVRELVRATEEAGLGGRTTVVVVSDHGFRGTRRAIRPNAALRVAGLLEVAAGEVTACDLHVVPTGGTAMVYVTDPERREELLAKARPLLASLEGVASLLAPADYPAFGLPRPDENDQAPDLVLVARPGYGFHKEADGDPVVDVGPGITPGHHGYLASDPDMDAIFIAWGYGIRAGVQLDRLPNVDVAPTVAALLGLTMPGALGRARTELFDERILRPVGAPRR